MDTNLTYKGYWFLPSAKENEIYGTLSYDNGWKLELIGNFENTNILPTLKQESIILGRTSEGQKITLYGCFGQKHGKSILSNEKGWKGSPVPLTYTVNYIFEGIHIENKEELKFKELKAEIHNLNEWLGIQGFEYNPTPEDYRNHETTIKYKLPKPIEFIIDDKVKACFKFVFPRPNRTFFYKEINLVQKVQIIFSTNTELDFDEMWKYLINFEAFLTLALYKPSYPLMITFLNKDKFVTTYTNNDNRTPAKIKFYYNPSAFQKPPLVQPREFIFNYQDIKDCFRDIISGWYEKVETLKLKEILRLLMEQFYNNIRYILENQFLNLAQALEAFHIRTPNENKTEISKENFDKIRQEILENIPEKHHELLKRRFNNRITLEERITELIDKYSNEFLNKIIGNKDKFIKDFKNSRNYYTHYPQKLEKKALKGTELSKLSKKVQAFLVYALLSEIGFSKLKLQQLFEDKEHSIFAHLISKENLSQNKTDLSEEDIWKLALQYPRDKKWVYEDLHNIFPQDLKVKVEIIQNELYINHQSVYDNYSKPTINMVAPNLKHQEIVLDLAIEMKTFAKTQDLGTVYVAPIDVKFDKDHSFQPDIVFVAKINYDILQEKAIEGSPNLVVEVISPSNHKKEMDNKKATYEKFGVSEYWIIRPKEKSVKVEVLDENGQYEVFKEATEKGAIESKILAGFEVNVEDVL